MYDKVVAASVDAALLLPVPLALASPRDATGQPEKFYIHRASTHFLHDRREWEARAWPPPGRGRQHFGLRPY